MAFEEAKKYLEEGKKELKSLHNRYGSMTGDERGTWDDEYNTYIGQSKGVWNNDEYNRLRHEIDNSLNKMERHVFFDQDAKDLLTLTAIFNKTFKPNRSNDAQMSAYHKAYAFLWNAYLSANREAESYRMQKARRKKPMKAKAVVIRKIKPDKMVARAKKYIGG